MNPAHDGTDGNLLNLGNLFIAQTGFGEQHKRTSERGGQSVERSVEDSPHVLLVQASCGILKERGLVRRMIDVSTIPRKTLSTPTSIQRSIGHNSQQPGPELAPTVEAVERRKRLEHGVLDRIERVFFVPEQPKRHPIGYSPIPVKQFLTSGGVPVPDSLHQGRIGGLCIGRDLGHTFPLSIQTLAGTTLFDPLCPGIGMALLPEAFPYSIHTLEIA